MPKPSPELSWATDATFTNGPAVGTPTKVTPSAGLIAEGEVPKAPAFPQRTNWWRNKVATWVNYFSSWFVGDEVVYPVDKARQIAVSAIGGSSGKYYLDTSGPTLGLVTLENGWKVYEDPTFGVSPGHMECPSIGVAYYVDITPHLRSGMVLGAVTAWVKPATSQATVGDRMSCQVYYNNPDAGTTTLLGGATADDTTAAQGINVNSLGAHVVNKTARSYIVRVVASQGADPALKDVFRGLWLNVTEPAGSCGPRNY